MGERGGVVSIRLCVVVSGCIGDAWEWGRGRGEEEKWLSARREKEIGGESEVVDLSRSLSSVVTIVVLSPTLSSHLLQRC